MHVAHAASVNLRSAHNIPARVLVLALLSRKAPCKGLCFVEGRVCAWDRVREAKAIFVVDIQPFWFAIAALRCVCVV